MLDPKERDLRRATAEGHTLSALLFQAEKLHEEFPYPSFHHEQVSPDAVEAQVQGDEFRRLEESLAANFNDFQELRGRLRPWEDSKTALLWSWAAARRVGGEIWQLGRVRSSHAPPEVAEDSAAECRTMCTLL